MKKLIVLFLILFSFNAYAAKEVLAPTTSAGQSSLFSLKTGQTVTIMLDDAVCVAGEYSDVQYSFDSGISWVDLKYEGTQIRLHCTNNMVTVYGAGIFRVDKEATTNATGIYISRDGDL